MEGLIPFIIRAMKKQRPGYSYRSLSGSSNRSYHLLLGGGEGEQAIEGSSHRRTRSEFQPPSFDFLEQRLGGASSDYISNAKGFTRASSSILSPATTNVSRQINSTATMASYQVSMGIKS